LNALHFRSLPGLVSYEDGQRLQRELLEARARDEIVDTVLFLEHSPVITRGKGLQWVGTGKPESVPLELPLPGGLAYCESERGGDLTYHGPGQLVIYPIVKLGGPSFGSRRDVGYFLREFEGVLIDVLLELGLVALAKPNATGVWVGERKLASIGIAVRKWVSWHGMAINVVNDLTPFRLIRPCGFAPEVMTKLEDLVRPGTLPPAWRPFLESRIKGAFTRRAEKKVQA